MNFVASTTNPSIARATLELRIVGELKGKFTVPAYQRGYRWGQDEVKRLLMDLREASGRPYCLQPVVVWRRGEHLYELVDGQQRLTTIYLLFAFFRLSGLFPTSKPPYTISYDTRDGSEGYLETLEDQRANENIDFFYLNQAHRTIHAWFELEANERQALAMQIYLALMKSVQVVWYEVPAASQDEVSAMFTRLNAGRIPLTDAELFKALLLSKCQSDGTESSLRAGEVVMQWDAMERDLRRPDVWGFVSRQVAEQQPTRILLLLEALASRETGQKSPALRDGYRIFEALRSRVASQGAKFVWDEVIQLHALVMGWYEHRSMYHRIGWLVAVRTEFSELVAAANNLTRSAFEKELTQRIRDVLALSQADIDTISYESEAGRSAAERLLLLMNIETIVSQPHSTERYPFQTHHTRGWSLEHIHAQHPEVLRGEKEWRTYLQHAERELGDDVPVESVREETRESLRTAVKKMLTVTIERDAFQTLAAKIADYFSSSGATADPHGIANLALLGIEDNAALNNSVFAVKRRLLLRMDREGKFIPVCTRQVFLKSFEDADTSQLFAWSNRDRAAYRAAIELAVSRYLRLPQEGLRDA